MFHIASYTGRKEGRKEGNFVRFSALFCTFYRRIVRIIFALIAAWLFVSCLVTTTAIVPGSLAPEVSLVNPDNAWLQCILFVATCLVFCFFIRKISLSSEKINQLRFVLVGFAGLLSVLWIISAQPAPYYDARIVQQAAIEISKDQTFSFEPGEYIAYYPHQSGLVLLHLLLQHINPDTTLPFQMFNALCYTGILYLLGELSLELGFGNTGCIGSTVLGIVFFPLLLYVPFLYGNISGLCFSMAAILLSIRFSDRPKWQNAVSASTFLFLAITLKSNYQIFGLGLIFYSSYLALRGQKHYWLLCGLLLVGFVLGGKLPSLIVEQITGCSLRNGISTLTWVAMGLRTDSVRGPGWYSDYILDTYFTAKMDPTVQNSMVSDCISGILQGWLMNPKSMVSFFWQKNATQWSAPLFQSILLNARMRNAASTAAPQWVNAFLSNPEPPVLTWLMNLLQTLIYGGLVLWAWVPTHEKREPAEDLLAVILVGGFVFHTFWEAKSQYTLPYVVLILPLTLLGYRRLAVLAKDENAKALWQSPMGKLRFLMPVLLMALALVLSVVLAPSLNATLQNLLQTL